MTSLKWLETNNLFNNLIQRNQSAAFSSGKVRPNHETNINIIARRTGKDVNSHTVLDGIITTIMATIQRINIIGSREGSRNRRRLVLITLLNVTLIILTLSVSRLLNLLLRLVAFLLFLNPQCLASISRWITASSSWKRFCLFVCRALSSIMVICMLTAIRLLLTFVMSLYLLLRS